MSPMVVWVALKRSSVIPISFVLLIGFAATVISESSLCSYYSQARHAEPQYNLPNCSWYRDLACCRRTEVTSVLGSMFMIHSGTKACKARLNYMMCYFCSPDQAKWYEKGKVNICSMFCEDTYKECMTSKLHDTPIGEMYSSGKEFCLANSFEIIPGKDHCFDFDPTVFGSSLQVTYNFLLLVIPSIFLLLLIL